MSYWERHSLLPKQVAKLIERKPKATGHVSTPNGDSLLENEVKKVKVKLRGEIKPGQPCLSFVFFFCFALLHFWLIKGFIGTLHFWIVGKTCIDHMSCLNQSLWPGKWNMLSD